MEWAHAFVRLLPGVVEGWLAALTPLLRRSRRRCWRLRRLGKLAAGRGAERWSICWCWDVQQQGALVDHRQAAVQALVDLDHRPGKAESITPE